MKNYQSANIPTKFASMGTHKLAYRELGDGSPIIMANRFRGTLDDWDPAFLDALATNHRIIIFDYQGLGRSTGKQASDYIEMARDVMDLSKALGIEKFAMLGWSLGGFVAQLVHTEFPEHVSHGIFVGTRPPGKDIKPPRELFFQTATIQNYTLEHEVILFFNPLYESSKKAAAESHERIALRKDDHDVPLRKEQWEKMFQLTGWTKDEHGTLEKLMKTQIPYLVFSGEDDICFPVEDWFRLNQKLPKSLIVSTSESGHGPQHQYPELAARYISDFIGLTKGN